jgi:hypothetical protein
VNPALDGAIGVCSEDVERRVRLACSQADRLRRLHALQRPSNCEQHCRRSLWEAW